MNQNIETKLNVNIDLLRKRQTQLDEISKKFDEEWKEQYNLQQSLHDIYKIPILSFLNIGKPKCPLCKKTLIEYRHPKMEFSADYIYKCDCGYKFAGFDTYI